MAEPLDLSVVDADLYEIRDCYDPEMPGSRWTGEALRVADQLRAEVERLAAVARGTVAKDELRGAVLAAVRVADNALGDLGECGRREEQDAVVDAVMAVVAPVAAERDRLAAERSHGGDR